MSGVQGYSHLGPFRADDPAYALALPLGQVACRSEVAAQPSPVYDAMMADRHWSDLLDRRTWWLTGKGGEPIVWKRGTRDVCDSCGRDVGLRRDFTPVAHNSGPGVSCPNGQTRR